MRGHAQCPRHSGGHSILATQLERVPKLADIPPQVLSILRDSIKMVPAVKYAFGIVGMAAAGLVITGLLGADWPKIIAILFVAMVLLFVFSLLTRSASKVKYAAEFLSWIVVIGLAAIAVGTISFVVSGEPRRLGVLLDLAREEPLPSLSAPVSPPANEVRHFADAQKNILTIATCKLDNIARSMNGDQAVKCPPQPSLTFGK